MGIRYCNVHVMYKLEAIIQYDFPLKCTLIGYIEQSTLFRLVDYFPIKRRINFWWQNTQMYDETDWHYNNFIIFRYLYNVYERGRMTGIINEHRPLQANRYNGPTSQYIHVGVHILFKLIKHNFGFTDFPKPL